MASVFDQNHKDNHKNSMAGTTIVLGLKAGKYMSHSAALCVIFTILVSFSWGQCTVWAKINVF